MERWGSRLTAGHRGLGVSLLLGSALIVAAFPDSAVRAGDADGRAASASTPTGSRLTPSDAFEKTLTTGVPTLVLVTSSKNLDSLALWKELRRAEPNWPKSQPIHLTQVPVEELGKTSKMLGITKVPTLLVYRRDGTQVRLAGQHSGPMDVRFVQGWLALYVRAPSQARDDDELLQTTYQSASAQSSPQQQPTPPSKVPSEPQPPPQQQQPPPYYPQQIPYYYPQQQPAYQYYQQPQMSTVMAPAPAPIFVQPTAPTIFMGNAPQPNVVSLAPPTGPSMAPPASMAPPNILAPPTQPSFAPMPPPQPSFAPMPPMQPSYAPMPPTQPAFAPMPTMQPAFAPQPFASAPANLVAAAPAPILTNPRLFSRLLGTFGDVLSEFGNPRIRMSRSPAYEMSAFAGMVAKSPDPGVPMIPLKKVRVAEPIDDEPDGPYFPDSGPPPSAQDTDSSGHFRKFFRKSR